MIHRRRLARLTGAMIAVAALAGCHRAPAGPHTLKIGFSQVTTTEPWRVLFNKQMRDEAAKHPNISLTIADGQDRTDKQVSDVEAFIRQKVDLILLSPKESAGLSGVVEEAKAAGIPVIVLDRKVSTDQFTQFIGSDNLKIGALAGQYAVQRLGGAGHAKGEVIEIWGGMASSPAQERHQGFMSVVGKEPGVHIVVQQDGDWKQDKAYNIMAASLKVHPNIDMVYAHNDPMAYGAYLAAKDVGRDKAFPIIGIDGMPDEGATWVKQGALAATFLYAPPGAEAIRQALLILDKKPVAREISLPTEVIDASTVDAYLAKQ